LKVFNCLVFSLREYIVILFYVHYFVIFFILRRSSFLIICRAAELDWAQAANRLIEKVCS
jgi:hypothetical protein